MRAGRPKSYAVTLSDEQRSQLESFARSRSLPHALARRAKIILMAADGMANSAIAAKLEVSNPTIADWCRRYIADGIDGLYDLPPGHRRRTSPNSCSRRSTSARSGRPTGVHEPSRTKHRSLRAPSIATSRCLASSLIERAPSQYRPIPSSSKKFATSSVCI